MNVNDYLSKKGENSTWEAERIDARSLTQCAVEKCSDDRPEFSEQGTCIWHTVNGDRAAWRKKWTGSHRGPLISCMEGMNARLPLSCKGREHCRTSTPMQGVRALQD